MSNVRSLKNVSFDIISYFKIFFEVFFYKMTTFFVISLNVLSNPLIKTKFYWEIINAAAYKKFRDFKINVRPSYCVFKI